MVGGRCRHPIVSFWMSEYFDYTKIKVQSSKYSIIRKLYTFAKTDYRIKVTYTGFNKTQCILKNFPLILT